MSGAFTDQFAMLFNTPITLALVILEIFVSVRYHKDYYKVKDTKANLVLGLGYVVVDTASRAAGLVLLSVFYFFGPHVYNDFSGHLVLYWVTLVLAEDFSYWFMHLMDHKIRFLWAGHIHHHSSREFNFSVGLRSAVFEPIEKFLFFIPMAFIGFRPLDIVLVYVFSQGWGTFVHTRMIKKLGPLEYVFTTPSHHRVHHGRNPKYLDKNYGMFLIIWDKIFGTFTPEDPNEPVEFGTVKNLDYKNYADIVFNEYRQIIKDVKKPVSLKEKIRYIFGPPGYNHEGAGKTTRELQVAESLAEPSSY
ncbi:MAG: sterol desaturase family protein [Bacteroidota bacterium]|nr:sterol desaturase family protein [Bacteroidota bacterium]